jgi:phosphoribosylamine---glycine ligase
MEALMERVLVVGHGAREHALAHKLAFGQIKNTKSMRDVIVLGGNPGIARDFECVTPRRPGIPGMVEAALKISPDLVVIGPENYLADGLQDALHAQGIKAFGPNKNASQLESSKSFTKQVCTIANVQNASFAQFADFETSAAYIKSHPHEKLVIKVDGLCAGKGVFVCSDKEEGLRTLHHLYRESGLLSLGINDPTIIIEEYLSGFEVSVFGAAHGSDVALFCPMQDYKRLKDFDQGPNTGGMGSVGPLGNNHNHRQHFLDRIKETIFLPILTAMKSIDMPFSGLLYAGLMLTPQGIKLLEFNVRFGDPETQALLTGSKADIYPLLHGIAVGQKLDVDYWQQELLDMEPTISIVIASSGYPLGHYPQQPITLPKTLPDQAKIFFAKTAVDDSLNLLSDNGRVLNLVASGPTIEEARSLGYKLVSDINFRGMHYRFDIGTEITELGLY